MPDPLADVIALLQPRAVFSKTITGAGSWAVRYSAFGEPSFCTMLSGRCLLAVEGQQPIELQAGDFVLMPATPGFTLSGGEPVAPVLFDARQAAAAPRGELRHGRRGGAPDARMLGGYFRFASPDAALLVSLLPALMHLRGIERLSTLVGLVGEESTGHRAGRDLVLGRLVEILLVEALRSTGNDAPPGLLRGLADARVAAALRLMHGNPARPWTMEELAGKAALSRSAFFDRFSRSVGMPPMEYLLAWRMALAKDLLRRDVALAEVAERVGYGSASTFSTAFSRHVGQPPGRYAKQAGHAA